MKARAIVGELFSAFRKGTLIYFWSIGWEKEKEHEETSL